MRQTNFDMDALRSFVSGIELGSFARAADRLGRSTSAISAQLKKLEGQAGTALVQKSGRGLLPTERGEEMLSFARRILALNDEAAAAFAENALSGWVRIGLQADFGEALLPGVLGRFARNHPQVRVEGRIGRNADLKAQCAAGKLDLALLWDDGGDMPGERVATVPLCWLGAAGMTGISGLRPLPLVVLDAPCILRDMACRQLDQAGIPWRIAFVSPSLGGMWAATAAGLGIALRTSLGCPSSVRPLLNPSLPALRRWIWCCGRGHPLRRWIIWRICCVRRFPSFRNKTPRPET